MDDPSPARRVVPVAWAGFLLLGWSGVLLPSLVRQIEGRFGVDDASLGLLYLAASLAYATAAFSGGILTERLGRRVVLGVASGMVAVGLVVEGVAPSWGWFLLAAPLVGLGDGAIDGGLNGLVLDAVDGGRGRALNLLHLCFSIGAFVAPLLVGRLVSAGVEWQLVLLATGVAFVGLALALSLVPMPSGRILRSAPGDIARAAAPRSRTPLALLGVAIACYVAAEIGVSNWIVRFLSQADLNTATLALSGFWVGLALGRLASARVADRLPHGPLAAGGAVLAGVALVAAVVSPSIEIAIGAIVVAGFAMGPVYPLIIAIGGELYRDRASTTAGTLAAIAVVGGTTYPPLVGVMSASIGIGGGMLGAALLSILSAVAILAAARVARRTMLA